MEKAEKNKVKDMPQPLSIHVQLAETPRIGESIVFEFVPWNTFERGIVYDVRHKIQGKAQIVEIYAHPSDTEYDRWMKLKEEYEVHQKWKFNNN